MTSMSFLFNQMGQLIKYKSISFLSGIFITFAWIAFALPNQAFACAVYKKNEVTRSAEGSLLRGSAAQHSSHSNHSNHAHTSSNQQKQHYSPAIFEEINHKMHEGMNVQYSNQVDVDFLKGMIPHHQGAVDMANVVLTHSKNPKVRKLAKDIIDAQNKEIEMMKSWLKETP
jgi:uncharacterized protein (DUF305 family)